MARGLGLLAPVRAVGKQRLSVHEERRRVRKVAAQLVEDGEAMGVNVAPVVHTAFMQPSSARQRLPTVAGAKNDDGSRHLREGEEVGLVLGDYATAVRVGGVVWTQDFNFEKLPNVEYFPKSGGKS